jgi:hypothetical protein
MIRDRAPPEFVERSNFSATCLFSKSIFINAQAADDASDGIPVHFNRRIRVAP